jgi:hypothetical protein
MDSRLTRQRYFKRLLPQELSDLAHVMFKNLWRCVESITLENVESPQLVTGMFLRTFSKIDT